MPPPHHVPPEWSEKYRGQFDDGWDRLREEIFARQQELGVVPADAELTTRPRGAGLGRHARRPQAGAGPPEMEVYAGFLEHIDHHVGRLVDALADLEVLDDTLIFYIIADNGACAEGTTTGTFNESLDLNGAKALETTEFLLAHIDEFGSPAANNHYAVGWAHAMDTPYQWTKQIASHWGGTRNGTVVHWPGGIRAKSEVRAQFHHVIDIAPTILDVAGLPHPLSVNGVQQMPLHGVSMRYAFDDATAPDRHETQYFETFVNRGIYHRGWTACTRHSAPWITQQLPALDDDVWELYGPDDWTQAHDLAAEQPDKLRELQRLFLIEAARYNVLPLDDRRYERFNAELAGRPQLVTGTSQLLFAGMGRLSENSIIVLKNKSMSITASITVPDGGANGVLLAQGGAFGGLSLYLHDGRPAYCYNLYGIERIKIYGDHPVPAGDHQVRAEFTYDGGGLAKGGHLALYVDGTKVGEGRIENTVPMIFSADETTDVGTDAATSVSDDYGPKTAAFTGQVHWVQLDTDNADVDHLINPDERLRIALARQ